MLPLAPAGTPYKMAKQEFAFNGDTFLAEEFLRLRDKHDIFHVLETGSYIGTTTLWFAMNFGSTTTCEMDPSYYAVTSARTNGIGRVFCYNSQSVHVLRSDVDMYPDDNTMMFLDAHALSGQGVGYGVLIEELMTIAEVGAKPQVIVMHDMQVPGHPELQFDRHGKEPFTYEWVKPHLDRIYGEGGYSHYWNSQATGAKVGVLFVERNKEVTEPITNPTL
jgi:hypothetical protein